MKDSGRSTDERLKLERDEALAALDREERESRRLASLVDGGYGEPYEERVSSGAPVEASEDTIKDRVVGELQQRFGQLDIPTYALEAIVVAVQTASRPVHPEATDEAATAVALLRRWFRTQFPTGEDRLHIDTGRFLAALDRKDP